MFSLRNFSGLLSAFTSSNPRSTQISLYVHQSTARIYSHRQFWPGRIVIQLVNRSRLESGCFSPPRHCLQLLFSPPRRSPPVPTAHAIHSTHTTVNKPSIFSPQSSHCRCVTSHPVTSKQTKHRQLVYRLDNIRPFSVLSYYSDTSENHPLRELT